MEQALGLGLLPLTELLTPGPSAAALPVFQALLMLQGCSWVQLSLG